MPTTYAAPTSNAVQTLLAELFPHTEVENIDGQTNEAAFLATYTDENEDLVAMCAFDMEFAVKSASALSMMRAGDAQKAIQAGKLDTELLENLHEILGIYANLIVTDNKPKPQLQQMYLNKDLPEAANTFLGKHTASAFCANLPNYGTGSFAFIVGQT